MTLNFRMIVERHPNPNGVVGSSIFNYEIFSLQTLLDGKTSQVTTCHLCSKKERKEKVVTFLSKLLCAIYSIDNVISKACQIELKKRKLVGRRKKKKKKRH